jgi:hypothetical protein
MVHDGSEPDSVSGEDDDDESKSDSDATASQTADTQDTTEESAESDTSDVNAETTKSATDGGKNSPESPENATDETESGSSPAQEHESVTDPPNPFNYDETQNRITLLNARLSTFANQQLPSDRRQLVEKFLTDSSSILDVYYAIKLMHEWNIEQREQIQQIKSYFRLASAFLLIILIGLINSDSLISGSLVTPPETGTLESAERIFAAITLGSAGATTSIVFSGAQSLVDNTTDPSVPKEKFIYEALLTRILLGGIFGFIVLLGAQTTISSSIFTPEIGSNITNILFIALLSGFFDKIFKQKIEDFVNNNLGTSNQSPNAIGGDTGEIDERGPDTTTE